MTAHAFAKFEAYSRGESRGDRVVEAARRTGDEVSFRRWRWLKKKFINPRARGESIRCKVRENRRRGCRTAVKYLCRMTSHFCIIPSLNTHIRCSKSIMHGEDGKRQGGRTVTEATVITRKMVVLVEPDWSPIEETYGERIPLFAPPLTASLKSDSIFFEFKLAV